MLFSHCGKYMANGLTNAVRHEFVMIANDRQTFVQTRHNSVGGIRSFSVKIGINPYPSFMHRGRSILKTFTR